MVIKTLCLTYEYPPIGGGGSTTIHEINKRLVNQDIDLEVLTTGFKGVSKREYVDGAQVSRIWCGRRDRFVTSFHSMLLYTVLASANGLRKTPDFDIVHGYFVLPSGIPAYHISKLQKKPLIITVLEGISMIPQK